MSGIDDFLNIIVPLGAIVFMGVIMFRAFGSEMRRFGEWIKEKFTRDSPGPRIDPQYQEIQYVK